jgi:hypothetical protein
MRLSVLPRAAGVCAILMMAAIVPSAGQSETPQTPVVKPPGPAASSRPTLELFVETYGAQGQDQSGSSELGDQGSLQERRFYSGIVAGMSYRKSGPRATFAVNAGDSWRYYQGVGSRSIEQHGGVSVDARPWRRTAIRAAASALYTPSLQLLAMPGIGGQPAGAPISDAAFSPDPAFSYGTSMGLTRQIDRQSDLSFDAGVQFGRFASATRNTSVRQVGAMYTRRVADGLALKIGDTVQVLQGSSGEQVIAQNVTLGFGYDKSLALSRRTRVGFSTGSSMTSNDFGRHYGVIGKAEIGHAFGRTWESSVTFDRNLRVVEFLPGPFLANASILQVGGSLGPRLTLRARSSYAFGNIDLVQGLPDRYSSILSELRLSSPLGRHVQLYGEYVYYEHRFPVGLALPAGLAHRRLQRGVRAGIITVWAPLSRTVR